MGSVRVLPSFFLMSASKLSQEAGPSVLRAIFTPTFVAISLINMLGLAGYYAVFVISTRWMTEVFGASTATAGLATGIVVIGCLVGRFFTGAIVHSFGYRLVLGAGAALYLATNLAYFGCSSAAMIMAVRFLSGFAVGVVGTVTGTVVAVTTSAQVHGRAIAYFSMSTALALCFGPFLGIGLLDQIGYEGIFAAASALAAANLLLLPLVRAKQERTPVHKLSLSDFIEPKLIPFSLLVGVVCLAWGNIQAFLASYAQAYDLVAAASSFFLVYACAILVSRPFSGKICDMHGPAVIIFPALAVLALGLLLLWGVQADWAVLCAGALLGLGFGNFQSVAQVSAIDMVPRSRYAQATSTFYIFFDFGIGIAPYLSGHLEPYAGFAGIYGINAAVVAACIVWYACLLRFGKHHPKPALGEAVDFSGAKR